MIATLLLGYLKMKASWQFQAKFSLFRNIFGQFFCKLTSILDDKSKKNILKAKNSGT